MLKLAASAGGLTVLGDRAAKAEAKVEQATRATPAPIIKDIQVIATQPGGQRLTVVKVITDQAGLYGYGCGTISMRAEVVNVAVDRYLKPLLVGKPANRIEDTWQMMVNSAQWRFGPILNNAMSGVDEALWDIKGRQTGLPVYELFGGKCREAAETYWGMDNTDTARAIDGVRQAMSKGFRNFRAFNPSGGATEGLWEADEIYEPGPALRAGVSLLEECRKQLGPDIGLAFDIHRKATPNEGLQFAKDVEHLKMLFVEDPFSNQDFAWHRLLRQQCSTPIAVGELFTNPNEWVPLLSERLIDYILSHVSALGGVTPCRKQAAMAEVLGIRTLWHGSPDISPIGHMANVHLDVACYNTGYQEYRGYDDRTREVFKGCPEVKKGYIYANDKPGWGIEIDEKLAAKYPYGTGEKGTAKQLNGGWGPRRWPDGTIYHP
jgi:mannonate dehydratase